MTVKIHEKPKRPGGDRRGNSADRFRRKLFLLSAAAGFGGNGEKVPCVYCGMFLDMTSVEADRINPAAGYVRTNVQPACRRDNAARGNRPVWTDPQGHIWTFAGKVA